MKNVRKIKLEIEHPSFSETWVLRMELQGESGPPNIVSLVEKALVERYHQSLAFKVDEVTWFSVIGHVLDEQGRASKSVLKAFMTEDFSA